MFLSILILLDILFKTFMPIDKVSNDWERLLKETSWMHVLGIVPPNGMDSKVLF